MKKINFWFLISTVSTLLIVLPNLDVLLHIFDPSNAIWEHIKKNLLLSYINTTLILVFASVFFSAILALSLSWILNIYDFPLKNFFKVVFLLPISIPTYIGAYTYSAMFSFTGSIQIFFRSIFDIPAKYFDIMNLPGAIFIFTIFLFPYTYIGTYAFLNRQSASLIESARLLSKSKGALFFKIVLPLLRVPLVAGSTLIALDILSDYGVVSYFGIPSFSFAIFKSWQSFNDINSALKLSGFLLLGVLLVVFLEKLSRGKKLTSYSSSKIRPLKPKKIKGIKMILILFFFFILFSISFLIPIIQMIYWAIISYKNIAFLNFFSMLFNTIWIAFLSTALILVVSLIIANYKRLYRNKYSKVLARISNVGYSLPSAVIALSVLLFITHVDRIFHLQLVQSIIMVIFAYLIRYLMISYTNVESGFEKVGLSFNEASRLLGRSKLYTFFKIDLPSIKVPILAAFTLSFVDIAKELTIVLILRPFNFNTLATKVFEYANDEMIVESSLASLLIILISLIPLVLFYILDKDKKNGIS